MCDCTCSALSWWKERQHEKAIDEEIMIGRREFVKDCKVLLLGAGESGKSTMVKQMRIRHNGSLPEEERRFYRQVIYRNILESAQAIIEAMLNIGLLHSNQAAVDKISDCVVSEDIPIILSSELTNAIHQFWTDPTIERVIDEHGSEFYLMDNATYFFAEIRRISSQDYIPTETDVLNARHKTTKITETQFPLRDHTLRLIDVGGQRSERRKWIHCFQDVTNILFFAALSEYDQVLREDRTQNAMEESLRVFNSITASPWFQKTSIILFLNKKDVFEKKVSKSPVGRYFHDYQGGEDYKEGCDYFKKRFARMALQPAGQRKRETYVYVTTATDTAAFRIVMAAVEDTVLTMCLRITQIL